MKINQIDNKAKIICQTLENIVEIEKSGEYEHNGPEGKKTQVKFKGTAAGGSNLIFVEIPNNNLVRIVATYPPKSGEEYNHIIAHKNEQNRWDKDLIVAYKDKDNNYFPCPFGSGGESPITHHWSEYAGERIDHFQGLTTDIDKITAKFASALTAKKETIQKILNGKEFTENSRKIDAIKFENADAKRILRNYLENASYKLEKALCRYKLIEDIYITVHEDNFAQKNNQEALANIRRDIEFAKQKLEHVKELTSIVNETKFEYAAQDFVLVHSDLNLDNILVNAEKDYEISFIDGSLKEKQTLQDHYGPKQIYYFIFSKTKDWLNPAGDPTRMTYASLSQMFDNLLSILREDYAIDENNRDKVLKDVIDAYFDSFHIKKNAERKYEKTFGKSYKTDKIIQKTLSEPKYENLQDEPHTQQE